MPSKSQYRPETPRRGTEQSTAIRNLESIFAILNRLDNDITNLKKTTTIALGNGANIYLDGIWDLVMDADRDTWIDAPIDDQININIFSALDFTFTPNSFNVLAGSNITVTDFLANSVIYSDASKHIVSLANGAGFLQNNGAGSLSWAVPALIAHDILSVNHTDTLAGAVVRGDVIIGNSTPKWSKLAIGGANTILKSNGTDPAWNAMLGIPALTAPPADRLLFYDDTAGVAAWLTAGTGLNILGTTISVSGVGNSSLGSLGTLDYHAKFAATGLADSLLSEDTDNVLIGTDKFIKIRSGSGKIEFVKNTI